MEKCNNRTMNCELANIYMHKRETEFPKLHNELPYNAASFLAHRYQAARPISF